jgi:hypothetical protein
VEYDLKNPPNAEEWLASDESERIAAVRDAHLRAKAPAGQSPDVHATIHVVVENRLAAGDAPVLAAYERFRAAGIGRHVTIHALASVVTRHMMDVMETKQPLDAAVTDQDFAKLDPNDFKPR